MRATLDKLVTAKSYPEEIRTLAYDPMLAVRGLVVDHENGNIFKPDRYGFPGRARHGLKNIDRVLVAELYQRERTRLSSQRYAWIDSLFALPEAVLYSVLVDYFDSHDPPGKPDYTALWHHIRECIDLAHRDGSIKAIVSADFPSYVERDEALAETLHKFRSSGKRLFLLTNSAWDYTSAMMSYLLDGAPSTDSVVSVVAPLLRRDCGERGEAGVLHRGPAVHRAGRPGQPAAQEPRRAVPARARLLGWQHQGVPGAGPGQRRSRAFRRRPHLRRHAALAQVVELAHGDDPAGARARGDDAPIASVPR